MEPYRTGEDTVLLAKGVERLAPFDGVVSEIGCGSGLITEVLAEQGCEVISTDIDLTAVEETWRRVKQRGLDALVHTICCDRLEPLRAGEVLSFVAFNPPYLPGEEGDLQCISGPTGVEAALQFAASAASRLREGERMLFLLSSSSAWESAVTQLRVQGFMLSVLRVEHVGLFEDLLLLLAVKARQLTTIKPNAIQACL